MSEMIDRQEKQRKNDLKVFQGREDKASIFILPSDLFSNPYCRKLSENT